jgi:hypothetical protein
VIETPEFEDRIQRVILQGKMERVKENMKILAKKFSENSAGNK